MMMMMMMINVQQISSKTVLLWSFIDDCGGGGVVFMDFRKWDIQMYEIVIIDLPVLYKQELVFYPQERIQK
jgi:hypothetical protein